MHYVRHLIAGAKKLGYRVTLGTTEKARQSGSFQMALEDQLTGLDVRILPQKPRVGPLGQIGSQINLAMSFKALVKDVSPDISFIPYGNYIDKMSAFSRYPIGRKPWGMLTMRESFHHAALGISPPSKSDKIKERLYVRQLACPSLLKAFNVDELLEPYLAKKRSPNAAKVVFCAEPVVMGPETSKQGAREQLGIRADQRVLLIYGHMDERKGLDRALESIGSLSDDCALLVAGHQESWAKGQVGGELGERLRKVGRLYILDSYLDSATEQACFAAADSVWLGYRGHYASSGVLTQAAVVGLPVVSCNEGLLGYRTKSGELGLTVDIENAEATSAAVSHCLHMSPQNRDAMNQRAAVQKVMHSPEVFAGLIYRELLGSK